MAINEIDDKKKPAPKQPVDRAKLVKLLTPARKPQIQAETPSLQNISITGKRVSPPVDIAPSIVASTEVSKPVNAQDYFAVDKRKEEILSNTIKRMASADGLDITTADSSLWKEYEKRVIPFPENKAKRVGEQLVITKDEFGNTVYANQLGFWESQSKKYKEYQQSRAEGANLIDSDEDSNIKYLENIRKSSGIKPGMLQKENTFGALLGEMREPLMTGTVAGLTGAALNALTFGAGSKISATLMTGTVGYDMSVLKYGQTLKENYFAAREQGMSEKEAYEKANNSAIVASGIELVNQGIMAGTGAISEAPSLLSAPAKVAQDKSLATFAKSAAKNAKTPLMLGLTFGLGQAASDQFTQSQGIEIDNDFERSITTGGHMMAMDMAFKAITHAPGMIGSMRGASKAYLSKNKGLAKELLTEGEKNGMYPEGTKKKVMEEVRSYDNAKSKTPEIEGEEERTDIVVGLTEKMLKLEKERDRVADVHKPKIQAQIDEVAQQIETAKTAKDPYSAEKNQAGVPITKVDENATTETTKQVEEGTAESGVGEYPGVDKSKQGKTEEPTATTEADTGNRPVSGTEEVGKKFSYGENIRKLKVDTSKLSEGGPQSNIAGIPIAVYNSSVEAIALLVDGGMSMADAIQKQITELKNKGWDFLEDDLIKRFQIIEEEEVSRLEDKRLAAKRRIATAEDTDLAIKEYQDAVKNKQDFVKQIEDRAFERRMRNELEVDLEDEKIDSEKEGYEYSELYKKDPKLAIAQRSKDRIEFLNSEDYRDILKKEGMSDEQINSDIQRSINREQEKISYIEGKQPETTTVKTDEVAMVSKDVSPKGVVEVAPETPTTETKQAPEVKAEAKKAEPKKAEPKKEEPKKQIDTVSGLPIAIYNASAEAVSSSVKSGMKLEDAIAKQIKALKEGGYKVDEKNFTKNVTLNQKLATNKNVINAEVAMEGVGSADYAELQRIAREKYAQNDIYKDPTEMGKALRQELSKKKDTSSISDDIFEWIGYDAIAGEEKIPFVQGAEKRVVMPEEAYFKENILTNPKEAFKAMYTAASNVGKSVKERFDIALDNVAEAIKGKRGLRIPAKDISKAIKRFVSSKMDTDTAAQAFAENVDDIVKNAVNARTISENKAIISSIKKASRSKAFGTIATRETTAGIDFIASSKVENPSEYQALLQDYNNSITGELATKKRQALIDYIDKERTNYEAKQQAKREAKIEDYKRLYDKYVAEGKIDETKITKDEYVESRVNPDKSKEGMTQDKVDALEESENLMDDAEVEAEVDISQVKKEQLKEAIDNGEIPDEYLNRAKAMLDIDINKVQNKNKKLFNNIIEDMLNGEEPSRIGEIVTDIERYNANEYFKSGQTRIRTVVGAKTAGILRTIGKKLGFDPNAKGYDELSITNLFRAITYADKETKDLRAMMLGDFEKVNKGVNVKAKNYLANISTIFNGNSIKENGAVTKFTAPKLNESNSYRLGVASALLQGDDLAANIQTIIDSTKDLGLESKSQKRTHSNKIKNIVNALESLGIATNFKIEEDGTVSGGDINPNITMDDILAKLNDREAYAMEYTKRAFADVSSDLNTTMRDYFGVSMNMDNPNYIPLSTYLTGIPVEPNFDKPLLGDLPDFLRTMRSGTTMRRNVNLVRATNKKGVQTNVYYDFDFFSALPKRYHETVSTTYNTAPVRRLSKIMSSPDYNKFIAGKFNSTPDAFAENIGVFGRQIREYVNMERTPFVITREMARQRSATARFFYGRLINSVDAAARQYIPSIPTMFMEDPLAYFKAVGISKDALISKYDNDILTKFLSQTSQASRITGGIEAMSKAHISIDNNAAMRNFRNAAEWANDISAKSIEYGDKAVTAQSLLIGYMRGLQMEGLLDNPKNFNLEQEVKNGLNQRALSYAETFLSIVNNESTSAGKAKIFRENNASFMRMLQSFNHNATMNFLIDVGRYNDYMQGRANADDGSAALKRMGQYLAGITTFSGTALGLSILNYEVGNSLLDALGVDRDENNELKGQKRETEGIKYGISLVGDALTGRLNLPAASAVKLGLQYGLGAVQSYKAEPKEAIGQDISNKWYSNKFKPFYTNEYLGVSGQFMEDVDGFINMISRDRDPDQDLIDEQRNALKWSLGVQGTGYLLPFKDLSRIARYTERNIREHQVNRLDVDAYHFRRFNNNEDYKFTPADIEESKQYLISKGLIDNEGKISNNDKMNAYYQKKVLPRINQVYYTEMLYNGAKKFGEQTAKDMLNIAKKSGMDAMKIINNRYNYKDMTENEELMYALQMKVVSPVEYALAFAFDKKGKLREDIPRIDMDNEVMKRYSMAAGMNKGAFTPLTPEQLAKFYLDYMSTTYIQGEREK